LGSPERKISAQGFSRYFPSQSIFDHFFDVIVRTPAPLPIFFGGGGFCPIDTHCSKLPPELNSPENKRFLYPLGPSRLGFSLLACLPFPRDPDDTLTRGCVCTAISTASLSPNKTACVLSFQCEPRDTQMPLTARRASRIVPSSVKFSFQLEFNSWLSSKELVSPRVNEPHNVIIAADRVGAFCCDVL